MDYNTQRSHLELPEYGRIIQQMVDYCCTIEDRSERNKAARTIVSLMGNMNPGLRDVADFKHKLWDHLAIMSAYKLDIDWPCPIVDKELLHQRPDNLKYSDNKIKFRHYGKFVEALLKKISDIEDVEKRNALVELMANHMKRSYITWKKENISDDIVFKELNVLTNNKITIPEGVRLNDYRDVLIPTNTQSNINKKNNKNKNRQK